jgi:hypothetical protein
MTGLALGPVGTVVRVLRRLDARVCQLLCSEVFIMRIPRSGLCVSAACSLRTARSNVVIVSQWTSEAI